MKFICCFCYESIEAKENDPCNLTVTTSFDQIEEKQRWQSFFCHLQCFQEKVDPGILINMDHLLGIDDID